MDLVQSVASLVASWKSFPFIAASARASDKKPDVEIEPVIRATGCWVSLKTAVFSTDNAGGTVFGIVIPVPRGHDRFLSCRFSL